MLPVKSRSEGSTTIRSILCKYVKQDSIVHTDGGRACNQRVQNTGLHPQQETTQNFLMIQKQACIPIRLHTKNGLKHQIQLRNRQKMR